MKPLVPADRSRCQVEITPVHGFMVLGPRPRPERCPNKAVVVITQKEPGSDGRRGAMAICASCRVIFATAPHAPDVTYEELLS